jgi:RimJ/RimL family protein N-acetyltransferase
MAVFPLQIFKAKNGSTYSLRSAVTGDADAILHFMQQTARESGHFFLTSPEEFDKMKVEEELLFIHAHLENKYSLLLIAEHEGVCIGLLNIANGHRQRSSHIATLGISIAKSFQNQSVGTQMMKSTIEWARNTNKIEKIDLQVDLSNTSAIELYKKLGFQIEATIYKQMKMGPGQYADTLFMGLWI